MRAGITSRGAPTFLHARKNYVRFPISKAARTARLGPFKTKNERAPNEGNSQRMPASLRIKMKTSAKPAEGGYPARNIFLHSRKL